MMRLINKMPECRFVPPATKMQETRNKMPSTLEQRGGDWYNAPQQIHA